MDKSTPTSLYRYYDRAGVLLYTGITAQRTARNQQHNADKTWWRYVARQEVEHFPTRAEALAAERDTIIRRRPPFNVQHNPDKGKLGVAYEAYAASMNGKSGSGKLMQELKGRLPLTVVERTSASVTLSSLPEHVALASKTFPNPGLFLQVDGKRTNVVQFTHDRYGLKVTLQAKWADQIGDMALILVRSRDGGAGYVARKFE